MLILSRPQDGAAGMQSGLFKSDDRWDMVFELGAMSHGPEFRAL